MIEAKGKSLEYLFNYKEGKIKQGLGLGCELDDYLKYKPKQLVIILGHDNVGKTVFISFYQLALTLQHGLKWCVWSGENQTGQIMRNLIQMYAGRPFKTLSKDEILTYSSYLEQYFDFIDNSKLYKPAELLDLFEQSECNACLIDPFTGLDRGMNYEDNYKFLNLARHFVNRTGKTIYINTHPVSESGRQGNIYPDKHDWAGHLKPPMKDHIEGGKAFLNRCDDMLVIHRLVKHETMRLYTMLSIEKVKDTDTGGKQTPLNCPVLCEWNNGLGFKVGGTDVLKEYRATNKNKELW